MVVPRENTVVVSSWWMEKLSRAEEIWAGNNFINCSSLKSIDAAVISKQPIAQVQACSVLLEMRKNFYLFTTFNHKLVVRLNAR